MDIIIQAYSGVMSVTGFPDSPPLKTGIAVADFLGGTHLYGAIMTALYERGRTGRGRLVEVAMQEAIYPTLASSLGLVHDGSPASTRVGNQHSGLAVAPWSVYDTRDGHVTIVCVKDEHWHHLTRAMEQPLLKDDPRFHTNVERVKNLEALDAAILAWTSGRTRHEIVELAHQYRFPAAPVRTLQEVMNDPGMHERGMLETIDHPELGRTVVPGSPIRIHGARRPKTVPSPKLGQHTDEILRDWLGMDEAGIARLRDLAAISPEKP
jgi:crotonobetainyl-CoA:carnitine CoA-transferase CaiB-like acyl-CoA transferase